jgi:DNA-directed RNA polymerase specialized sigma24 family protein
MDGSEWFAGGFERHRPHLRPRDDRRELPVPPDPALGEDTERELAEQAVLADSVELALLAILDTLTSDERLVFVLHVMFDLPFEQIGPMVGRSPAAAEELANRARRRVRGVDPDLFGTE